MCAYGFSLIGRVELIPTHYCKYAITQCIIIFHPTLCGCEEHANQLTPRRQATLQLSCITRCYKRNKLGQKFAGKDSAAWGGNTPKEFKDSVPKFVMAFRPATDIWKVSHPLWVASLQKKPRRELTAIQQQFVQILFFFFTFFFRGNVTFTVQSFVPMRDSSSHAPRRMTPHANVGSHISRNISVSFTHREE